MMIHEKYVKTDGWCWNLEKHCGGVLFSMYQTLDTIKVDTVNKNVYEIVSEILTL